MAYKPTVGIMSDAFQSSFRQKQALDQSSDEFNRQMQEKERQSGLLNYWKEQNFRQNQAWQDFQVKDRLDDNARDAEYKKGQLASKESQLLFDIDKEIYDRSKDEQDGLLKWNDFNEKVRHNKATEQAKIDSKNNPKRTFSSSTADQINDIINPITKDKNNQDYTPEQIQSNKEDAFTKIKLETFKNNGRAYNFVNNIIGAFNYTDKAGEYRKKYPSPAELTKEVVKHAKGGGISNQDALDIDNFLNYYEQIYDGLANKPKN